MARRLLHLGEDFTMPRDAVTRPFGILGQRGSGKSSSGATMVEEIVGAGGRAVVLDPVDAHWGLTRPGRGEGLPGVILGGPHGDLPLESAAGRKVAEFVMASDYPVTVLSVKGMPKAQQRRFAADFMEALSEENSEPLMVVIEEAHRFVPQNPREAGDLPRCMGAIEDVVLLGRAQGLGITLITQRPAAISKMVLEQVETLIVGKIMGPNDRKAIKAWAEASGDPDKVQTILDTLAYLKAGEVWLWSPTFLERLSRVRFRLRNTFDSASTPDVGKKRKRAPKRRAPVDLDQLKVQMAEVAERAEARDPDKLTKRIRELQAELDKKSKEAPAVAPAPEPKSVEVPILTDEDRQLLGNARREFGKLTARLDRIAEDIGALASIAAKKADEVFHLEEKITDATTAAVEAEKRRERAPAPERPVEVPQREPERPPAAARASENGGEVKIKTGALRMMEALARFHPRPLSRAQLVAFAGVSARSGSDYLTSLRNAGWVGDVGREVALTVDGLAQVADHVGAEPPTTAEVRNIWAPSLKSGAVRMLDHLVAIYPRSASRSELMEVADVSARSASDYLTSLRKRGLAEDTPGREVQAGEVLFLGSR